MKPFNCLSQDCPIFGAHLLEASAGTGKTFAIEHVIVRLLLESEEMEMEQILAVTFTRAAVRDLKKRISANLQEALRKIEEKEDDWPYLQPFLGSERAIQKLSEALCFVDRFQIFTIHGFCHRILQEFAFEAQIRLTIADPENKEQVPKKLVQRAMHFLETEIDSASLCAEQIGFLLKKFDSLDIFARRLLKKDLVEYRGSFANLLERYESAWGSYPIPDETVLLDEFRCISSSFKSVVKGNFEAQIKSLCKAKSDPAASLRGLLKEKGSLFAFLSPENRKLRATAECPAFFLWAKNAFSPLLAEGTHWKNIFGWLQNLWSQTEATLLFEKEIFDAAEILKQTSFAIQQEPFANKVREKYKAVLIDEFQDTDPLQWKIFKTLFIEKPPLALYLVGDPKQSIYRFRKADVYTYFEARTTLGDSCLFCLDTNYRSSPQIIEALNTLFHRPWLFLPKIGETIPCPAIKAGATHTFEGNDNKGAIHCLMGGSFEKSLLPFAVLEIEILAPLFPSFSSFAILVKDRYEAGSALALLQERSIPAIAKNQEPLGKTFAFRALLEFFNALAFPEKSSLARIVEVGPFHEICLQESRNILEKEGLIALFRSLSQNVPESEFLQDFHQIVEEALAWEMGHGFSFPGLLQWMDNLAKLDPNAGGARRIESDAEAVQILTLHVSKGLEFDVVFALGLASHPPSLKEEESEEEEVEAEKLRQLYVAMTRAKLRLYIPLPHKQPPRKSSSPIEIFAHTIETQEGDFLEFLQKIGKTQSVTIESLPEKIVLDPPPNKTIPSLEGSFQSSPKILHSPPVSYLRSFTSLAQKRTIEGKESETKGVNPEYTSHTIPRGTDTGVLIHKIFETLFAANTPLWKNKSVVEAHIEKHLKKTPLEAWTSAIQEMVWKTLHLPLIPKTSWALFDLVPGNLLVEVEFLFFKTPHFTKGFIDLVFMMEGKLYFVDWKTNWLGASDASYASFEEVMTANDYGLQAQIYTEALKRHVKQLYKRPFEEIFGGAIYLFLRGGGVCHFMPNIDS